MVINNKNLLQNYLFWDIDSWNQKVSEIKN